jgi:bifunctional DNA-binding transcriptional regulator/antitoxin component of YhaV-PrlF toxin-antitoxin module
MAQPAESDIDPRLVDQHMRVVLPKAVVQALKLKRGDHVAFVLTGAKVEVRKVKLSLD